MLWLADAQRLVDERKKQMSSGSVGDVKKADFGKDLLSLLGASLPLHHTLITVRSNMASDVRPDQRMTDEEVISNIPLFVRDSSSESVSLTGSY